MRLRRLVVASLVASGFLASASHAQVLQLGRMAPSSRVTQASCNCSNDGPIVGTSGMAGEILGGYAGPDYGTAGLGYAGGFGYCGCGDCGACGVGGYFGRNLHQVNPCACGGSLIGDLARGAFCVVDKTVGCVVGTVCGGLRVVTCHASGSLAALESAARASCYACHGAGCDVCCGEGDVEYVGEYYAEPTLARPIQAAPASPQQASDPFLDDPPSPAPQASRARYPGVRRANYVERSGGVRPPVAAQRYLNPRARQATLRR